MDYTPQLRHLMQRAHIPSYRALATLAEVSRWQVQQLRVGAAATMRVGGLIKLSTALQVSLPELLATFGLDTETQGTETQGTETQGAETQNTETQDTDTQPTQSPDRGQQPDHAEQIEQAKQQIEQAEQIELLRREYRQLQQQAATQIEAARSQFQTEALRTLETWLVQWPTIAKRAKDRGAELPAEKILPFIRPVEALMAQWGVEAIAPVDAQVAYDPQVHQLMGATANPGDRVTITHSGATYQGKLLHRAKAKK